MRNQHLLRIVPATGEPFERSIDADSLVIGRSSESDLQISDRFMSRRHTRLFFEDGKFWVEDLGSYNGTLVNGQRISASTPVGPGDVIHASNTSFQLQRLGALPVEAPAPPTNFVIESRTQVLKDPSSFLPRDPGTEESTAGSALRRYADRLALMNDVHEALSGSLSLDQLLTLILDRVFDHLRPEQGVILLRDDEGGYRPAASRGTSGSQTEILYSSSLEREVGERRMAALVLDTARDERFSAAQSIQISGVRSLLAAPLLDPGKTLGMIVLSSHLTVREFTEEDLALLVSLASIASMRIHNVALLEEAAERRRLEEELALARRIQVALLPKRLPEIPGYRLFGHNVPSRWVSGDYYTVVERTTGRADRECVLVVADVSGKGMAASLLTASLEALAADPIEMGQPPEEICARVSRRLYQRTPPEKYATGFVAVLDPESGVLSYCNAGHNPGLVVRRDGEIEILDSTGTPLGLLPEVHFASAEARLEPGEIVVLYTDGITEATDPEEVEYGLERLSEVCRHRGESGLEQLASAIEDHLLSFADGVPFADDRTLVMIQRL